jgi:hypothetical protein
VVSPDGRLLKLLVLLIAASAALALTPQAFIAASGLAFAVSTAFTASVVPLGSTPIYFADFVVLLVAFRGILPRDRVAPNRALAGAPTVFFALWVFVEAIAVERATSHGVPLASALRGDPALLYWPLLYFGFTRVLRERDLNIHFLWRDLACVAFGLAGWMFLARAINLPFHDPGLALVSTGDSTTVQRNFGFAGAFVLYPVFALAGVAGMAHGWRRGSLYTVIASVGIIATLITFVRGEIFSLALAALIIFWIRPANVAMSARVRTAAQIVLAVVAAVSILVFVNPTLGNAVVQRALPFAHQAAGATANAEYRQKAVEKGFSVARAHPTGLGVLDVTRLNQERIDPGYLVHSGVATLLLFGGWPALITALLAVLALIRRSFVTTAATSWLHPAFVAILTMLSLYSISAAGLAGDPWVMPLGALAVALRFGLGPVRATTYV